MLIWSPENIDAIPQNPEFTLQFTLILISQTRWQEPLCSAVSCTVHTCTVNHMIYLQVPGRVGLLLTAYLIASNVYSSVEAPQSRGFCFIDVWMVGVQISILTAIFEYGIVLALIRATKDKNQQSKSRTIQVCVTGCTFVRDDSSKKAFCTSQWSIWILDFISIQGYLKKI